MHSFLKNNIVIINIKDNRELSALLQEKYECVYIGNPYNVWLIRDADIEDIRKDNAIMDTMKIKRRVVNKRSVEIYEEQTQQLIFPLTKEEEKFWKTEDTKQDF